jgi:hypothetical protein
LNIDELVEDASTKKASQPGRLFAIFKFEIENPIFEIN